MPIAFTHLLSGLAVMGIVYVLFHKRHIHPVFYLVGLFSFIMIDLDHLLIWTPEMTGWIFPVSWESLTWGFFGDRTPMLLHNWGFPIVFLTISLCLMKVYSKAKYLVIMSGGWAFHLFIDGVVVA